jgi:hypothetical protein
MSMEKNMTNKAFLSPLNFKFQVKKLPTFVDYVQAFNFPSVTTGETSGFKNPFQTIVVPGEHMKFAKIKATFKIDADLVNYREIFDWIEGLGKPTNFDQYAKLANNSLASGLGPQVDGSIIILDSSLKPNIRFDFFDLYPTHLSGFKLDYTLEDVEYITADVEFSYRQYTYTMLQ